MLAEIPVAEGLQVLAIGLVGVFISLAMLSAGVKLISVIVNRFEDSKEN
jgi:hypothetical protein